MDLSDVRVHSGADAETAAEFNEARALTIGSDIVLGGKLSLGSAEARRLVRHELAHVVQRRRAPSVRRGWSVPGDAWERHAHAVADRMTSGARSSVEAQPSGPAPAASRQETSGAKPPATKGPTEADAVMALADLRQSDPRRFVQFVGQNEAVVYALLSRYGFRGSWVKDEGYLTDFDKAFLKWIAAGNFKFTLPPITIPVIDEKAENEVILGALPDGTGYVGKQRDYRAAVRHQQAQRTMQTLTNITGGIGGAVGWAIGGDRGSDVGAVADGLLTGVGGIAGGRQQMRDVGANLGPTRNVPAEVRPANQGSNPPPTPPAPRAAPVVSTQPSVAPPRLENAPIPVVPSTPVRTPVVTPPPATPGIAATSSRPPPAATWKQEWDPLVRQAEVPTPRQNDNGYRTQTAVSPDGRTTVVITEGVVRGQVRGKSTADYGTILPGEHSTHPVGRQQGEDVGPSAQGSAPEHFNLSEMKTFENTLTRAAALAADKGGTVETRTVMVTQVRTVGGQEVQVLVGVRREADLRLPGRDPVPMMRLEAVIDPQTRAVTVRTHTY